MLTLLQARKRNSFRVTPQHQMEVLSPALVKLAEEMESSIIQRALWLMLLERCMWQMLATIGFKFSHRRAFIFVH